MYACCLSDMNKLEKQPIAEALSSSTPAGQTSAMQIYQQKHAKDTLQHHQVSSVKGHKPIAKIIITSLFSQGHQHGHLCCIISDERYGAITGNKDFECKDHTEPAVYNLVVTMAIGNLKCKQMEAQWNRMKDEYQR